LVNDDLIVALAVGAESNDASPAATDTSAVRGGSGETTSSLESSAAIKTGDAVSTRVVATTIQDRAPQPQILDEIQQMPRHRSIRSRVVPLDGTM